jgi:hypothetical protein
MFTCNSFSVRGLPRTYSLNVCLFNLSFVILTSEMVTYNLSVTAIKKRYGYFNETYPVVTRSTLRTTYLIIFKLLIM